MKDFQAFSGIDYIVDYIVDENYTTSYRKEILRICDKSQIRLFAFVVLQNTAKKCIKNRTARKNNYFPHLTQ